jgi:CBS domain-containing protein
MTCETAMSRKNFALVEPAARIDHAARRLREADVDLLVVTDGDGHALGVVTGRDIAARACADRLDTEAHQVRAIMTRNLITCGLSDELEHALALMAENQVAHVLVTGRRNRLLGVIGMAEVARLADPSAVVRALRAISTRGPNRPERTDRAAA